MKVEINNKKAVDSRYLVFDKYLIYGCLAVIVIAVLYWMVLYIGQPKSELTRGSFGDMFGALSAIFSGFAFVGLYVTYRLQRIELSEAREEYRKMAVAQNNQWMEMQVATQLQILNTYKSSIQFSTNDLDDTNKITQFLFRKIITSESMSSVLSPKIEFEKVHGKLSLQMSSDRYIVTHKFVVHKGSLNEYQLAGMRIGGRNSILNHTLEIKEISEDLCFTVHFMDCNTEHRWKATFAAGPLHLESSIAHAPVPTIVEFNVIS